VKTDIKHLMNTALKMSEGFQMIISPFQHWFSCFTNVY